MRFSSRNLDDFTTGKIFVYEVVTKIELEYSRDLSDQVYRFSFSSKLVFTCPVITNGLPCRNLAKLSQTRLPVLRAQV